MKRASNYPTLTPEQRAKLDTLGPLSTALASAPLSKAEIAALARVGSLSAEGWQVHMSKGTCVWEAKRKVLADAQEEHELRWPEWLDAIEAVPSISWGKTSGSQHHTMFCIELAACGFGCPYKDWPEGVGVLLSGEEVDAGGAAPPSPRLLTLGSDTEALRREGQRLEARYGRDAGNGWVYNHALGKLRKYQVRIGLQPASATSINTGLRRLPHGAALSATQGCSLQHVWLQEVLLREHFDEEPSGPSIREQEQEREE